MKSANGTVLVINHDPEVLSILEVNLTHAKLGVILARNSLEALRNVSGERPDVILLDGETFDTENADYWHANEQQEENGIPLIVIGTQLTGLKTGGAHLYVTTPFDPKDVISLVKSCLKGKEHLEPAKPISGILPGTRENTRNDENPESGTVFSTSIPRRWQSSKPEINVLLTALENCKQGTQDQLDKTHKLMLSTFIQIPEEMWECLENHRFKLQELLTICNRSLLLAHEYGERLTGQQNQLTRQEAGRFAVVEALRSVSREIAQAMHVSHLFDRDSARQVAAYSLTVANHLGLTKSDRQSLYHASLMKDMALVLSPETMMERAVVSTLDKALALKTRFGMVWKQLLAVEFLSQALDIISYRYERYDGTNSRHLLSGHNIPLGARILAITDSFDAMMTSELSPKEAMPPEMAIKKLTADAGTRFDPLIMDTFTSVWGKGKGQLKSLEGGLQVNEKY